MLGVLERFELESAGRGHGAFFPDSQPQLPRPPTPTPGECLGRAEFQSHLGARCCLRQGCDVYSWGKSKSPGRGGGGRDLEHKAIAGRPELPGDPSHTHTCRGCSWKYSGASWARVSPVECALNERLAGGRVFPTHALGDHGSAVLVVSVTLAEASALLCGWGRVPCPLPGQGELHLMPWKKKGQLFRLNLFLFLYLFFSCNWLLFL